MTHYTSVGGAAAAASTGTAATATGTAAASTGTAAPSGTPNAGNATPGPGIPFEFGGQVAGAGSCDFTLSDNSQASQVAATGATALSRKGFPTHADGSRAPGEQRYLLRSGASLSGLAYILYVVPAASSPTPSAYGRPNSGAVSYAQSLYGIAVVAPNGSVRYAGPVAGA